MDNNKNYAWGKTVMGVYKYLERITNSYDKVFDARAMSGKDMGSRSRVRNNTLSLTTSLIDLMGRKIALINLKVLTEKSLLQMDRTYARILILKYCDCRTSEDISKSFGFSTRTYFRKLNNALSSFEKTMAMLGYDSDALYELVKNEKWIVDAYKKTHTHEVEECVFDDTYITNVCNRMGKLCYA